MSRVIGVDYDSHQYHVAVIEDGELSVFETEDMADSDESVMFAVQTVLSDLSEEDRVFVERPIHIQNPNTTLKLAKAFSFLNYGCLENGIPFQDIRTTTWKKRVVGAGNAKKDQVLAFARERYGDTIKNQHLADATCIALAGIQIVGEEEEETRGPLVMCDSEECLWWRPNEDNEEKFIKWNRTFVELKGLGFRGTCGRDTGPAIRFRTVFTASKKQKVPECVAYSDKKISGHIDMSRFLNPKPYRVTENIKEI